MTEPAPKSPAIREFLVGVGISTEHTIMANVCLDPPMGCGNQAIDFRNAVCRREFAISGLCQACQDEVFTEEE